MIDMLTNVVVVRFVKPEMADQLNKDGGEVINPLMMATMDDALLVLDTATSYSRNRPFTLVNDIKNVSVNLLIIYLFSYSCFCCSQI